MDSAGSDGRRGGGASTGQRGRGGHRDAQRCRRRRCRPPGGRRGAVRTASVPVVPHRQSGTRCTLPRRHRVRSRTRFPGGDVHQINIALCGSLRLTRGNHRGAIERRCHRLRGGEYQPVRRTIDAGGSGGPAEAGREKDDAGRGYDVGIGRRGRRFGERGFDGRYDVRGRMRRRRGRGRRVGGGSSRVGRTRRVGGGEDRRGSRSSGGRDDDGEERIGMHPVGRAEIGGRCLPGIAIRLRGGAVGRQADSGGAAIRRRCLCRLLPSQARGDIHVPDRQPRNVPGTIRRTHRSGQGPNTAVPGQLQGEAPPSSRAAEY
mmetsp:Transcript_25949/g.76785  ORF Transcript_25949/g.76785 Transcript_25949/m.76785 type:complete len:317 (-) Transcript_25949:751-1701(-)